MKQWLNKIFRRKPDTVEVFTDYYKEVEDELDYYKALCFADADFTKIEIDDLRIQIKSLQKEIEFLENDRQFFMNQTSVIKARYLKRFINLKIRIDNQNRSIIRELIQLIAELKTLGS